MSSSSLEPQLQLQHIKQVSSLIHDERKCASIGGISLELGISRTQASHILEHVASNGDDSKSYAATYCEINNGTDNASGVPTTVFRLVKKDWEARKDSQEDRMDTTADDDASTPKRALYALSLRSAPEDLWNAHERELAKRRDMLQDGNVNDILRKENKFDAIGISERLEPVYEKCLQNGRRNQQVQSSITNESTQPTSVSSSLSRTGAHKPTTAASFFGKHKTGANAAASKKPVASSNNNAAARSQATSTVSSSTGGGGIKPPVRNTASSKLKSMKSSTTMKKTSSVKRTDHVSTASDEKENCSDKVGNADDFVGDVEDSSDEEADSMDVDDVAIEPAKEEKKEASKSSRTKETNNSKSKNRAIEMKDEEEDNQDDEMEDVTESKEKPQVKGAMDAFASSSRNGDTGDNNKPKRRRKKLVEKTSLDEKGYLHTQTVEIWEDVPSDEEDDIAVVGVSKNQPTRSKIAASQHPIAKKTKTAAGGKSTMKQGSLAGFFKKK